MRRSQKPDKKEFLKISQAVGVSTSQSAPLSCSNRIESFVSANGDG